MSWLTDDLSPYEADLLMQAFASETVRRQRLERAGICVHGATVTTAEDGAIHYPEQMGLADGQIRCRDCLKVWEDEGDYAAEIDRLYDLGYPA